MFSNWVSCFTNATAKTAILFIQPQYNVTTLTPEGEATFYQYGWKDGATIVFYFFIAIILHAVVQEYLLDKINRRLHLSKSKNTKFNESGQLCVFHLVSSVWSCYVLLTVPGEVFLPHSAGLLAPRLARALLPESTQGGDFPPAPVHLSVSAAHLCSLFIKVSVEQKGLMGNQETVLECMTRSSVLSFSMSRVGLVLLFLQYVSELGFHTARMFYFIDENHQKMFDMWAVSFVFTRMVTLTLMFLAVGFGLARSENQELDLETGNFNTVLIRMTVLLLVCLTQSWLLWKFIRFQLRRWREFRHEQAVRKKAAAKPALRPLKRDSLGHHENGVLKAENGASPRTRKLKSP
ncbi:translocating chain-associated membrane protein 2 isoform X3 [Antennarius striatus]|uniref:translocating chain-associated membrane protein 2 isoform X3 n=1 Tax=Antennarius striatus TaxID=241820 RepID=UPI0035B4836D